MPHPGNWAEWQTVLVYGSYSELTPPAETPNITLTSQAKAVFTTLFGIYTPLLTQ